MASLSRGHGFCGRKTQSSATLIITLGFSVEYGGRDGFIDDLYLVPAARGRGVGRKLIDFALAQARELGVGTLHLEVETGNDAATRLYRAAGFTETGRRLMRLRLPLCAPLSDRASS